MLSFKQFLSEMPQDIGPSTSNLDNDRFNQIMYDHISTNHRPIGKIDGLAVMHNKKGNETKLSVLDHGRKKVSFSTTFKRNPKSKQIPFPHHTQTYVGKHSEAPLKKGFVSNFIYNHLVHGKDEPLVSDEQQYAGGHKLWHHLINQSFKEGHHAYLHDDGKLTKITPENKEEIMNSSYGKGEEFKKKRYVISKNSLD